MEITPNIKNTKDLNIPQGASSNFLPRLLARSSSSISSKFASNGPPASLLCISPSLFVSAAFPLSERGGYLDSLLLLAILGAFFSALS